MVGPSSERKLVYVVEDDEEQLTLLRMLFTGAGFDVVTESSADRVMEGVMTLRPDIVLLDVMLPSRAGLDGFQLCRLLREAPELENLPIIIVSAIAEGVGEMRDKILAEVEADDFFLKPYDLNTLLQRVEELSRA